MRARKPNKNNIPTDAHGAPFYLAIIRLLPPALFIIRHSALGNQRVQNQLVGRTVQRRRQYAQVGEQKESGRYSLSLTFPCDLRCGLAFDFILVSVRYRAAKS